ncbi:hypothetical protein LA345_39015 (plasmid) [Burkholderia vietnamiensis]|uniref:Uncharacterized protein n=1 Tax=Burkholderia vietnamiensis (strain G4 / LMG 22486) TaxID=269482 RepID=A4JWG3_BURVG|nr:conserved hypothetical protein [Burkholderia vietnamiensis G4]MCB4349791.1 hypothetical protein [Burkholderia vietnamiensis]
MSIFDEVTQRVSSQIASRVGRLVSGFSAVGAGRALLQTAVGKIAPKASGPLNKALNGDYLGAGLDALRQTKIGQKIEQTLNGKLISDLLFKSNRNQLLGGITPYEAQQICAEVQATQYAKKNLFFVEILDFYPDQGGTQGQSSGLFNLFATNISIGPLTISGEGRAIGAGVMDVIHGSERTEMRITTLDDSYGSIKRWFQTRCDLLAHSDGTFGVPADYLVQVRILHAAINDDVMQRYGGYEEKYIMRCGSLETELNRAEDGMQEIQMSFVQFDSFMFDQT